jgi:hypothetical protein
MLDDSAIAAKTGTPPRLRIGAVLAVALVAGFVAWLLLRSDTTSKPAPQASPTPAVATIVGTGRLRELAATLDHPLFWAGTRPGMGYELTRTAAGNIFIRYLPPNARPGDPRPAFLAIGTYPVPDAFAQTRTAGKRTGAVAVGLKGGGIAVYDSARPTSVYFAYPDSKVQVEVFDPNGRTARNLVVYGRIVPIK